MGGRKRKRSSAPAPRTTRARRGGPSARGSCSPSSSTPFQREDGSGPSTSWTPAAPQQAASSRNPLPRQTGPSAHVPPVESRSPGPSPSGSSPSGSSLPPRPGAQGGRKRKRSSAPAPRTTRARRGGPSARGSCSPSSSTPFQREDGSGPSTSWTPAAPQQAASSRNPLPRQTGPSAHVPPVESRSPGPSPSGSSPSGSSLPPRPGAQPSRSHGPLPPNSLSRGHRDLPGEPQLTFPLWLHVWDEARFQELLGPLLPYLHHMEEEVWVYVSGSDSMLVTPPWASDPTIRQVEETLAPSSSFSRSLFSSELCYSASNR